MERQLGKFFYLPLGAHLSGQMVKEWKEEYSRQNKFTCIHKNCRHTEATLKAAKLHHKYCRLSKKKSHTFTCFVCQEDFDGLESAVDHYNQVHCSNTATRQIPAGNSVGKLPQSRAKRNNLDDFFAPTKEEPDAVGNSEPKMEIVSFGEVTEEIKTQNGAKKSWKRPKKCTDVKKLFIKKEIAESVRFLVGKIRKARKTSKNIPKIYPAPFRAEDFPPNDFTADETFISFSFGENFPPQSIQKFKSADNNNTSCLNVGGNVVCAEWCPVKHDNSVYYAAICVDQSPCLQNSNALEATPVGEEMPANQLLQLWCLILKNSKVTSSSLSYQIRVKLYKIVQMQWHPSFSAPDFLGLLALACSDGFVRLFHVPLPSRLSPACYDSRDFPKLFISQRQSSDFVKLGQCCCLDWSHGQFNLIAAGFGRGLIAIWDIECPEGSPLSVVNLHMGPVIFVGFKKDIEGHIYSCSSFGDLILSNWHEGGVVLQRFEYSDCFVPIRKALWSDLLDSFYVQSPMFRASAAMIVLSGSGSSWSMRLLRHHRGLLNDFCFVDPGGQAFIACDSLGRVVAYVFLVCSKKHKNDCRVLTMTLSTLSKGEDCLKYWRGRDSLSIEDVPREFSHVDLAGIAADPATNVTSVRVLVDNCNSIWVMNTVRAGIVLIQLFCLEDYC